MSRRTPDDDRPLLPEGHDVLAAIHLLEWAREKGFAVGNVTVGTVKFSVVDIRQAKLEGPGAVPNLPRELSVEEEYGAEGFPAAGTSG